MYIKFIALFLIFSSLLYSQKIDTTIIKMVDVTGDKVPEIIQLKITASNFYQPFIWTISIKSNNDLLYSYSENDSSSETLISLEEESGIKYEVSKRNFFYKNMVGFEATKEIHFGGGIKYLLDKQYGGSIYIIVKKYLSENSTLNDREISKIIGQYVKKIEAGETIYVSHIIKGLYSTSPMIYIKEVNKLVPIYSD